MGWVICLGVWLGVKQGVWDLIFSIVEFSYNNYVSHSTGKSPFQIVNG